jgi:hypothetical protein
MLSTIDDNHFLPNNFDEMAKSFDGTKLRSTVAAMAVDLVTVSNAVEVLTTELKALVVAANVRDFETARALGHAMMLPVYPTRLLLRHENPTRKLGPPVYSETNDRQRDIAQWILADALSAISAYDQTETVKDYTRQLLDRIPSPFRVGGKKGWDGVELE